MLLVTKKVALAAGDISLAPSIPSPFPASLPLATMFCLLAPGRLATRTYYLLVHAGRCRGWGLPPHQPGLRHRRIQLGQRLRAAELCAHGPGWRQGTCDRPHAGLLPAPCLRLQLLLTLLIPLPRGGAAAAAAACCRLLLDSCTHRRHATRMQTCVPARAPLHRFQPFSSLCLPHPSLASLNT